MKALFEQGELTPDVELTGVFAREETSADADAVLAAVEDARTPSVRAARATSRIRAFHQHQPTVVLDQLYANGRAERT